MWNEWTRIVPAGISEVNAECAGILESLYPRYNKNTVFLSSHRLWVFRRFSMIWPDTRWGIKHDLGALLKVPPSMHGKVMLDMKEDLYSDIMSSTTGLYDSKQVAWQWLRGLWGNNGSIYLPRSGYHLVFRIRTPQASKKAFAILCNLGLNASERMKSGYQEILLRNQEDIVTLFSRFRLYESSLYIEQRSLVRAMRDRANRLVNCDASNIRKSLEAAQKQIDLAKYFHEVGMYSDLPENYREVIDARLRFPSATLNELGQFLEHPVSKSTVKYRWKKLHQLAENSL